MTHISKRLACLLLAAAMLAGMLPAGAVFAGDEVFAEIPLGEEVLNDLPDTGGGMLPETPQEGSGDTAELTAVSYEYVFATDDTLADEQYLIRSIGHSRQVNMHASDDKTNQCEQPTPSASKLDPYVTTHNNNTHIWRIAAVSGGYTICSLENDKYLMQSANGTQLTLAATTTPDVFQITKSTTGYEVSWGSGSDKKYLDFLDNNGWKGSSTAASVQLYKRTEIAVDFAPPEIPGYTLVNTIPDGGLHLDKYYLVVGQSSAGDLYALKPDASSTAGAGAGSHTECLSALTLSAGSVTADGCTMDGLHFALSRNDNGSKYAFRHTDDQGDMWLCLQANSDNLMFSRSVAYQSVTMNSSIHENSVTIGHDNPNKRWLALFVKDDPNCTSYTLGETGWWGPGEVRNLPIFLYTYDGEGPEASFGDNISQMFDPNSTYAGANSWVFTGGRAVQGSFQDTKGARNFIGHFEEYIRSTKDGNRPNVGRQRHTISTAYGGQTLQDIVDTFSSRIADSSLTGDAKDGPLKPRAIAYMVGPEDYALGDGGIAAFKTNLTALISKSLALREGNGFAVIQTPYATNDAAANTNIEKYITAINEVIHDAQFTNHIANIVLVDHYAQTKDNAAFKATLNSENYPNGAGHLELGRQFAQATIHTTDGFPASNGNAIVGTAAPFPDKATVAVPEYLADKPLTVASSDTALTVTLPAGTGVSDWKYTLDVTQDDALLYTVSQAVTANFTISDLPTGAAYVLTVTSADDTQTLPLVKGVIGQGQSYAIYDHDEPLAAIQAKIDAKGSDGITWLFMGDSITHSAMWTFGYDGIAQSFEKYLKDDLGRTKDIVINTAVSGATTTMTHDQIDNRLMKYSPDVVSVMLGTNDAAGRTVSVNDYKEHLRHMADNISALNAVAVFRTPTPCYGSTRGAYLYDYVQAMREVAAEKNVILIDQFEEWHPHIILGNEASITKSPAMFTHLISDEASGMSIHPGAEGHMWMTQQFIKELGLWQADSDIYNLHYALATEPTAVSSGVTPPLSWDAETRTVTLQMTDLSDAYSHILTEATLTLTPSSGGASYSATALQGGEAVLTGIPGSATTFAVTVTARQGDANNTVTFTRDLNLDAEAELTGPVNISGYTRVTELPEDGLELGYYILVAPYSGSYYMLYPGATGGGSNINNAAKLVMNGNLATGYRTKAAGYDNGTVSSDFAAANNLIMCNTGETITYNDTEYPSYSVTAKNGSATYHLFQGGNAVYHTEGPSATIVIPDGAGSFTLRNNNTNHACLFFYATDMNFNQQGNAPGLDKLMLFKSNEAPSVPTDQLQALIDEVAGLTRTDYTSATWSALQTALNTANAAVNSNDYQTVTNAITALQRAKNSLQPAPQVPSVPAGATVLEVAQLKPQGGTTQNQPFSAGTGGGSFFRIPALVTLENGNHSGRIIATVDARWTRMQDALNIDTIVSYSDDGGKNWTWSFPNFFGDTELTAESSKSALFIDPVVAQDKMGTLYLMVNALPAGCATANQSYQRPQDTTGFAEIQGTKRMTVYTSPENSQQNDSNYSYYIGDFAPISGSATKYAPILDATDHSDSGFYADDHFYLYRQAGSAKVPANDKIYCQQINSQNQNNGIWIQQNLFFWNATLHVRNAQYLWLVKSTDGGETWGTPMILNDQVRTGAMRFYGPGPGAGLCLADGTVILPCYESGSGERSSFIYSSDGVTWNRAATPNVGSENTIVQIDATTVRQFYRSGASTISYVDYAWNASENNWKPAGNPVDTGAAKLDTNQLSSIRYSSQIDGKTIILISTATAHNGGNAWSRWYGKIHAFALNSDKTMTLLSTYEVNRQDEWYGYSSLAELPNGSIGLLYEDGHTDSSKYSSTSIRYTSIPINSLVYGGVLSQLIHQAEAINGEGYSTATWANLQTSLTAARAALTNGVKAELEAAQSDLQTAIQRLQPIPVVPTVPDSTTAYLRDTDGLDEGIYIIYSNDSTSSQRRILYDPRNTSTYKTDHVMPDSVDDRTIAPCSTSGITANGQLWEVKRVTNGYSFKNLSSERYLDLSSASTSGVNTSQTPVSLTVTRSGNTYTLSRDTIHLGKDGNSFRATTDSAVSMRLYKQTAIPVVPLEIEDLIPQGSAVGGQPFPENISQYRIPAITTLTACTYGEVGGHEVDHRGRLVAAVDARWNHTEDAGALDTMVSYSDDGGNTWHYSFANYFGDSENGKSASHAASKATTFIDPAILQAKDGALYMIVDLFPGGVATGGSAPMAPPAASSGYETINGTKRLVLYTTPEKTAQTDTNYSYYVGGFVDGYATVYEASGDTDSGFYVDEYYYLYQTAAGKARTPANDKIYCQQLDLNSQNNGTWIQQNVFFYNASLHVRCAQYLWLTKSTDGGVTWGEPKILNDQVHPGDPYLFCGPGPGSGLCMDDGTLIFPVYTSTRNGNGSINSNSERAAFIYSSDGGETWHRSPDATVGTRSSENFLVQIDVNTVRCFYRDLSSDVRYTDYTRNASGVWTPGNMQTVNDPNAKKDGTGTQISGIRYSQTTEDGRPIILLSTPTPGPGSTAVRRAYGHIYAFAVNNDAGKTMELLAKFAIDNPDPIGDKDQYFSYSSITELGDGQIGLLYENGWTAAFGVGQVRYETIPFYVPVSEEDFPPAIFLYDGQSHTITTPSDQRLTITYSTEENGNYVSTRPTFRSLGVHEVWYKVTSASAILGGVPFTGMTTVTITDQAITPELTMTATEPPAGGGIVNLTLTGVPSVGTVTVTCDDSTIEILDHGNHVYSADLPNTTATYLFTASYSGENAYTDATTTCTVSVAASGSVAVTGVTLPATAAVSINRSTTLNPTVAPSNASNKAVTWVSSDDAIATVDANGKVTGVALGSATITVTTVDGGFTAECTVTVTAGSSRPSGGGGGSTVSPPSTTVTVTDDGTTTVVTDNHTGTVTTTVTKPDGTTSEKVKDPDNNVTILVTDPDGNDLVQVAISADAPASKTKFEDVPDDHWAEKSIHAIAGLGIIEGVGNNRYDMTSFMTRGSLATVLYRFSHGNADYTQTFQDVANGKYYTEGVSWAAKVNVVKGISEDLFAPERTITREQLAVMLARYANLIGIDTKAEETRLDTFTDGSETGSWAVDGVAWCVETGILQGKGRNTLDPTAEVTRAEVAIMLDRFISLIQ